MSQNLCALSRLASIFVDGMIPPQRVFCHLYFIRILISIPNGQNMARRSQNTGLLIGHKFCICHLADGVAYNIWALKEITPGVGRLCKARKCRSKENERHGGYAAMTGLNCVTQIRVLWTGVWHCMYMRLFIPSWMSGCGIKAKQEEMANKSEFNYNIWNEEAHPDVFR